MAVVYYLRYPLGFAHAHTLPGTCCNTRTSAGTSLLGWCGRRQFGGLHPSFQPNIPFSPPPLAPLTGSPSLSPQKAQLTILADKRAALSPRSSPHAGRWDLEPLVCKGSRVGIEVAFAARGRPVPRDRPARELGSAGRG